jgi:translation initiation factor eIF-2B subunit epsilon
MSGVAEIYIYCGAHTAEVEKYIQTSKWHPNTSPASPFDSLEIVKTTARSVGDALRDLDNRALITGDFLLVHGETWSRIYLSMEHWLLTVREELQTRMRS